jgi:hypothetical protein
MTKYKILGLSVLLCLFTTCEKDYIQEDVTEIGSSSQYEDIEIDEDEEDYNWDAESAVQIQLNGNSITADTAGVTVNGSNVTIDSPGTYVISGTLNDGQIEVNTGEEGNVQLVLDNVDITCSSSSPVFVSDADKVIIIMTENSDNYLADGSAYQNQADGEPNATLFSKSDLSIIGDGTLNITGNYLDGIASKDGLIIKSGTYNITAEDDGVRGKDFLVVHNGTLTIDAGGDGLKSDNDKNTSAGFILIDTGVFDIQSGGDAISAYTNITVSNGNFDLTSGGGSSIGAYISSSAKGIKGLSSIVIKNGEFNVNSADDAIHSDGSCSISGGTITLASADDGIHADEIVSLEGTNMSITKSYEGIESAEITVNESTVRIVASDDAFNSTAGRATEQNDNSSLTINSGYIYLSSTNGDALDANGNIYINGGSIIVHGASKEPEVGMDFNGTCKVTGGFMVVSGISSHMTQAPSTSSSQNSVLVKFSSSLQANSIVRIENSSGDDIVTFAPVRTYQSVILTSSELVSGETYSIYTGGTCTGTVNDGLYSGGTYSGGSLYESFTISGTVTTVGSSSNGPGGRR